MEHCASSRPWTDLELAYLGGIIDGEGSIGVRLRSRADNGHRHYDYQMQVGNTDERLIAWLHERFGGTRCLDLRAYHRGHKPLFKWITSGQRGESVVRAVLPYLRLKRRQAELVLELRESIRLGNNQFSEVVWEQRAKIHAELRELNRRGPKPPEPSS